MGATRNRSRSRVNPSRRSDGTPGRMVTFSSEMTGNRYPSSRWRTSPSCRESRQDGDVLQRDDGEQIPIVKLDARPLGHFSEPPARRVERHDGYLFPVI